MSDLISRQALIEFLDDIPFLQQHYNLYVLLLDWINQQPKVNVTDTKVGEWIPCSERLPEKAGFYVVTKRQKSGEIQVALGSYRPMFKEWSGNGNFKDVVAWMPLPEPYKEGKQ